MIKLNFQNILAKIDYSSFQSRVDEIDSMIVNKTGEGADYLGWVDWPMNYDHDEVSQIINDAKYVREHFDILVVVGIGGSYLGARAAIEAINGLYSQDKMEIIFLGQTFSPNYVAQVLTYLKGKKFAINVISKSGTTTETAISFRLVRDLLINQIGLADAKRAIFATTDKEKGALKKMAELEGYRTYVLPGDIGGRYSVLTAVGLFPMAVAGIDINEMMRGAKTSFLEFASTKLTENSAYKYAVTRDYFYHHNKEVELYVLYENQYTQLGEWLKQLYGESEGKQKKGLWPASATFSTDLHSLGQFVQDGTPLLFETILYVKQPRYDLQIPANSADFDGLNYLAGRTLADVNEKAFLGTLDAHVKDGRVPCIIFKIDEMNAFTLGYLFYFFMRSCAMSAYLLGINPFNQPGVEIYKRNMFHLLGKKGY